MSKINRRDFLLSSAPLITVPALLSAFTSPTPGKSAGLSGSTVSPPFEALLQSNWRWCMQCYMLYWNGYPSKGVCAAGGGHDSGGSGASNYYLQAGTKSTDFAESPTYQAWWNFCGKCYVMFFWGYARGWGLMNTEGPNRSNANLGRCAAGLHHRSQGYYFWLQHDVPESSTKQGGWRFCSKCYAMFWDPTPQKGKCPGGGAHSAQGYKFVLTHDLKTRSR